MFVLILLGYALIVLIDVIPAYKNGIRREPWVSTSLLAVSLIVAVLFSLGVNLSSPADSLRRLITKIYGSQREDDV